MIIVIGNLIMIMEFMNPLADVVLGLKRIFAHIAVDLLLFWGRYRNDLSTMQAKKNN